MNTEQIAMDLAKDLGMCYTPAKALVIATKDPVTTNPPLSDMGVVGIRKIIDDMVTKERELWSGKPKRMGNGAIALMLNGYRTRLEVAIGDMPIPRRAI